MYQMTAERKQQQGEMQCANIVYCMPFFWDTVYIVCICCCIYHSWWIKDYKKHLKNVGPIRHCEPLHCHSPGVATVARRLRIDVRNDDDNNNDNAWHRGPLWPHRIGPIIKLPHRRQHWVDVVQAPWAHIAPPPSHHACQSTEDARGHLTVTSPPLHTGQRSKVTRVKSQIL